MDTSFEIKTISDRIVVFLVMKVIPLTRKLANICVKIQKSNVFQIFMLLVIIANSILLSFYQSTEEINPLFFYLEVGFLVLYTIECLITQISYGYFITYIRDPWNALDLCEIVISILCLFHPFRSSKSLIWFRALRPTRVIKFIPELKAIINSVTMSMREMLNVLILVLFVFLIYAVFAVNIWAGIFSRRCRIEPVPVDGVFEIEPDNFMICGGLNECTYCKSYLDFVGDGKYFLENTNVKDEQDIDELNYGYSTFDNFFAAFLTIYHCMTLQGWSKIMYMVQNGYSYSLSSIYFITLVVILNFLVLNFLISILMNNIEINMKLNHCEDNFKLNLVELETEAKKILKKEVSFLSVLKRFEFLFEFLKTLKISTDVPPKYFFHLKYKITYYCYVIAIQPFWDYINYSIVIADLVFLTKETGEKTMKAIRILNLIFFNVDWILKLLGYGREFFKDYQNILNLVVSIVIIFEYCFFKSTVMSVVKLVNLLNIVYALKDFQSFEIILFLLQKTISSIGYFFILILILVYIFALIGITFFKGAFEDMTEEVPRKNFQDIGTAMKTVFGLMIGDDWYIGMIAFFRTNKVSDVLVYIYFILSNLILSILMMNLVVAFLVYHFEQARRKQKYKSLISIIKQSERLVGYKRSMSFSFSSNSKLFDDYFLKDDFDSEDNELNKSDLFDYEIICSRVGINYGETKNNTNLAKVVHDVNTDKILSLDTFGFGNIFRKMKNKTSDHINPTKSSNILSQPQPESKETNERRHRNSLAFGIGTKQQISFKIPMQGSEDNNNSKSEFFLNDKVDKDNFLKYINKPRGSIRMNNFLKKKSNFKSDRKSDKGSSTNTIRPLIKFRKSSIFTRGGSIPRLKFSSRETGTRNFNSGLSEKSSHSNAFTLRSTTRNKKYVHRIVDLHMEPNKSDNIKDFTNNIRKITKGKICDYMSKSSLFIFHKNSLIRKICIKISSNTLFNIISLILVIMSCIVILIDTPYVDKHSKKKKILYNIDGAFTIIFFVEMTIRIIALGLFFEDREDKRSSNRDRHEFLKLGTMSSMSNSGSQTPLSESEKSSITSSVSRPFNMTGSFIDNKENTRSTDQTIGIKKEGDQSKAELRSPYLRNIFNIMDCIVIITNLVSFLDKRNSPESSHRNKALIAMRAFRPLRMISNFNQLRQVVQALILSIPSIIYMILIALVVFFIYAVIGFNFFKGYLGECELPIYKKDTDCISNGFEWVPNEINFDSISSSLLTVYELSSTSGWYDVMEDIVIATDNNFTTFYFITFMVIGTIFIMNFSVTCVVDTFITLREKLDGSAFLIEDQKDWVKSMKMFMKFKPVPTLDLKSPKISKLRKFCYTLLKKKWFNIFINFLIFSNVITFCLNHSGEGQVIIDIQSYVFYISTFFFIIEMTVKLIAYKKLFFIEAMNKFDFVVVILSSISVLLSIIDSVIQSGDDEDSSTQAGTPIKKSHTYDILPGIIKGIRVLRVFRLINLNYAIKNYLQILLFLFPQLINIFSLILMSLVVFSILGIELFSTVKYGEAINDNCNFRDFPRAIVLLVRVLTGDEWNDLMHELATKQPGCVEYEQSYESLKENGPLGCGKWVAYPFFIIFMILNTIVIANMLIAVIVGTFIDETSEETNNELTLKETKQFYSLWSQYDSQVTYYMEIYKFVLFMLELDYPMGLKGDKMFVNEINQTQLKGRIYCSFDKKNVVDESQCFSILDKLGVFAKGGKIHILDAIKLITKRMIIAKKESEEFADIENYKRELRLLEIKQKRIGKKLMEQFKSYHFQYDSSGNELSSKAFAKSIICKLVRVWKAKRRQREREKYKRESALEAQELMNPNKEEEFNF